MSNDTEVDADGLEKDVEAPEPRSVPFDATKIRINQKTMTLDLIMKRIKHNELDMMPDFQRAGGIWNQTAKSRLIESLLILLPIPSFFFDATNEDLWVVIDGLQRLDAISKFVEGHLTLSGLEFLTEFEGKTFKELPRHLQRRIEEVQVSCYVIEQGTPERVKLILFKRINTGGMPLSSQEIRHAINPGVAREFLKRLSGSEHFTRATANGVGTTRMVDRECVLRFMAFMLKPYTEYRDGDLDFFLNEAMKSLNETSEEAREDLENRFYRALSCSEQIFGNGAFRKRFAEPARSPINKALFEVWTVCLGRLSEPELQRLVQNREQVIQDFAHLLTSDEFMGSISQGTNHTRKVNTRFRLLEIMLSGFLKAEHND